MKTKLTLSIAKKTLDKAKRLSIRRKTSLSKLFEEYIEKNQTNSDTPISDALTGILENNGRSYDEMRYEALKKKHDL
jgi:hypothetical protein